MTRGLVVALGALLGFVLDLFAVATGYLLLLKAMLATQGLVAAAGVTALPTLCNFAPPNGEMSEPALRAALAAAGFGVIWVVFGIMLVRAAPRWGSAWLLGLRVGAFLGPLIAVIWLWPILCSKESGALTPPPEGLFLFLLAASTIAIVLTRFLWRRFFREV